MSTTIQIRVDQKMKEKARKVFHSIGLSLSGGVKLYLTYVTNTGKLPPGMFTMDNISESETKKIIADAKDALKHGRPYKHIREQKRNILDK